MPVRPVLLAVALALGLAWADPSAAAPPFTFLSQDQPTLAPLLEKVTPAVVNIAVRGRVRTPMNPLFEDPFFRRFFDIPEHPRQREVQSAGSGVVIDAAKGHVVTNHHVIQNADEIKVTLHDGRSYTATVVGSDPDTDIAVLQLKDFGKLSALPLGDSSTLRVGDFVLAIGNPFGLGQTVTSGIVSGLARSGLGIEEYEDFIQTDASINPGNSGGALVNLRGELVGINTAIVSPAGGNVGIGFAIPINMARQVQEQLLEHGEVRRGQIGVLIQDLNPQLAEAFDLEGVEGAVVSQVVPGSPAEQAGLEPGDVIVEVDGKPVSGQAQLRNRIGLMQIGTEVELTYIRNGDRRQARLTIGPREVAQTEAGSLTPLLEGATFSNQDPQSTRSGSVEGVVVSAIEQGSPAWRAGLREGDVVMSVNRQPVRSVDELRKVVGDGGRRLLLHVRRGNGALFIIIQ